VQVGPQAEAVGDPWILAGSSAAGSHRIRPMCVRYPATVNGTVTGNRSAT
jgi:hypothetical protein